MTTRGSTPTEAQRLDQYRRNAALSLHLEGRGDRDWAVTTMFYAVLQLVDVYLARLGQAANRHRARHDRLRRDPSLRQIIQPYLDLQDASLDARYGCYVFSPAEVHQIRTALYEPLERQFTAWLAI